jgi:hypothetical protein
MSLRGPALVAVLFALAFVVTACDSGGVQGGAGGSSAAEPSSPNPTRRLGLLPQGCPAPRPPPRLISLADYGNLVGASPVWAGFYANYAPRRGGYRVERDAPRTRYGWRIKVLWVVAAEIGGRARVEAKAVNGRSRLWFNVDERATRPRPHALLDPAQPGVPPNDKYLEFPTYVFIPRAGCYRLDVSWSGGSWRLVIGVGR